MQAFSGREKYIERGSDYPRKLDLSCVAMCDIAEVFNTPVIRELDRKYFMFMSFIVVLDQLDKDYSNKLALKYPNMVERIRTTKELLALFVAMTAYANTARNSLQHM